MPNIFGAGLLDLLSQGGQFIQGRQARKKDDALEAEKQRAALEQALLDREKAGVSMDYTRAMTHQIQNPSTGQGTKVRLKNGNIGLLNDVTGEVKDTGAPEWIDNEQDLITDANYRRVPDAPGVTVPKPAGPQVQYVIGPDNKLVEEGPGVEVRTPGTTSTVQQKTNENMANSAEFSNNLLNDVDEQLATWRGSTLAREGKMSGVANFLANDEQQAAGIAAKNFINPVVRYFSGLAMTESETKRYFGSLIGRWGDGDPAIRMKAAMRAAVVQAMKSGALPQGTAGPNGEPDLANLAALDAFMADFQAKYRDDGAAGGYDDLPDAGR